MQIAVKISKMGDKLIIIIPKNYHKLITKEDMKDVMITLEKI
tara:strand:- start:96 stop:221 length:126 start_codon:yes stop_codon:yes gene_type:complete